MNHFNPSLPLFGDPYAQTSANANINNRTLYVGNLDKDIERQKLFDCFAAVVTKPDAIERVDLRKDFNGESKGYAFITFATHNDAQRAKTVLNHSKIKENSITISFMRKGKELDANANLFFRKLNKDMTSKELEELCAPYGPIVCAKLRFDSTGHSLGYGYVQFEKEQNANECMEALNGANVKESIIEVKKFTPASKRGTINQKCNVYVKDFPSKWNEKEVTDFIDKEFGKGGKVKITSKCVAKDQKLGKFYAFVAFETPDKAKEAIESLKDKEFSGEANRLYVDYAMTKEERRKKLREQHNNPKNETNLFIKSLAKDVTEDRLQKVFEKFGPVTSVCVKTHELNKANAQPGTEKKVLKFGFINFGTSADAAKTLAGGKADQEVKSLIDPTHYKDVEFLYMHQPKSVRNQYIKMDLRNKKNLQAYEKQFNFFKQMLSQFNRGQPGQKGGFPGGNKKPFDMQGGRKPGMDAMNPFAAMGMNPMMMQQYQMNPQAMVELILHSSRCSR
jgi:RNA recognition motif-containing protein